MERQKSSGWLQTAATLENEKSIEEMICSPEDHRGTHVPSKDITIFRMENDKNKRNKRI